MSSASGKRSIIRIDFYLNCTGRQETLAPNLEARSTINERYSKTQDHTDEPRKKQYFTYEHTVIDGISQQCYKHIPKPKCR